MLYPQRLFNLALPRIKKVVDGGEDRKGTKKAREGYFPLTTLYIYSSYPIIKSPNWPTTYSKHSNKETLNQETFPEKSETGYKSLSKPLSLKDISSK